MDVNKVETALKSVGVQLRDANGEIRDFDKIIVDLGTKWDGLSRNAQRYVATIAAGSRQQSRFIALLDDFDRTVELMDIAAESEGKADEQFAKYADTMEYKLNQLSTEWEKFKTNIIEEDLFKNSIEGLTEFIKKLNSIDFKNPFNVAEMGAGIAVMITGITKSIALMKASMTDTSATFTSMKKDMPQILATMTKNHYIQKGKKLQVKLEATIDKNQLNQELNKTQQYLQNLRSDRVLKTSQMTQMSTAELAASEFAISGNVSKKQLRANYNKFDQQMSTTLPIQEYQEFQLQLKLLRQEMEATSGKRVSMEEAFEAYRQKAIQNAEAVDKEKIELELLDAEIKRAENNVEGLTQKEQANTAALQRNANAIADNNARMDNLEAKSIEAQAAVTKFASGAVNLVSSGLSTMMTYIPMVASGMMDIGSAAKMAGIQFGVMAVSQTASAFATALQAANNKFLEATNKGVTASYWEMAAAEIAALSPLYLIIAALAAIGLAVGGAVLIYKKWAEAHDEVRIATEKLNKEEEELKKIQDARVQTKSEKTQTKKELDDITKLKERYEELTLIKNKTTEQQEEENELIKKINEQFPEIITYHDTINNKLDLSIKKWETIIEKQKEAAKEAASEDYTVALAETSQEYQTEKAKLNQRKVSDKNLNANMNFSNPDWDMINQIRTDKAINAKYKYLYGAMEGSSQTFINRLASDYGLSADFLNFFSELEGYDLRTKEGMENFLNGQAMTNEEIENYLSLYDQRQREIANTIKKYNDDIEKIEKDYEEKRKIAFEQYLSDIEDDQAAILINSSLVERNKKQLDYSNFYSDYGNFTSLGNENQTIASKGSFGELTIEGINLLKTFGIETKEDFDELDEEILTTYLQSAIDAKQNKDLILQSEELIGNEGYEFLSDIIDGSIDYTQDQLRKKRQELLSSGDSIDRAIADTLFDVMQTDFVESRKKLREIYGENFGTNVKATELKNFSLTSSSFVDKFQKEDLNNPENNVDAVDFLRRINSLFDQYNISLDKRSAAINKDLWESYNPLDKEAFKTSLSDGIKDAFEGTGKDVKEITDEWLQDALSTNIISDDITPENIENYVEKASKIQDAFKDASSELQLFSHLELESVEISETQLETYNKLIDSLTEAGVADAKNLLKKDENTGKWIFNLEKANELMDKYGASSVEDLKNRKKAADVEIAILQAKIRLTDEDAQTLVEAQAISAELEKQIPILETAVDKAEAYADAFNQAEGRLSAMASVASSVNSALSNFQKNGYLGQSEVSSLQESLRPFGIDANNLFNKNMGLTNPEGLYKQVEKELINSLNSGLLKGDDWWKAYATLAEYVNSHMDYLEDKAEDAKKKTDAVNDAQEKLADAQEKATENQKKALEDIKKAEEDLIKIQEEYAEQLETIEEKQKAINDEIEKYNELLYGEENRTGKLDALYNYEQAISSLSNTLTKATDQLGNSEDINESVQALNKYTQATHNLIATEKAKQIQIQAGLSTYANMIENGTASYTNRETGEQIAINFGLYAKKDIATGKYILDQRLLNQAQFNDSYKDLIEENIETYNKYIDEYNSITDEIEKTEKELQDRRTQALKSYSDIEKTVADSLKAQYQEEVDNLKEKYNAMKTADDDYLSALEDALNKQRELRDRQDQYEDLAEQEKRLSLLQRDTSGTRQLDVNKLKKDVEKTRKQLLDDAVNDVVDGLKKLAKENEETRQVELQLRDAILENNALWSSEAESTTAEFTNADDYASYMAGLNPDFENMTMAQQEVQIAEYKEQFSEALEYQSWNLLDTTSKSGDAIVDTINVSTDQILEIVTEKTTSFSDQVISAYNEISIKVEEDLKNQEESIDNARDALQEAIEKLDEISQKAVEAQEKIADLQQEMVETAQEDQKAIQEARESYQEAIQEMYKDATRAASLGEITGQITTNPEGGVANENLFNNDTTDWKKRVFDGKTGQELARDFISLYKTYANLNVNDPVSASQKTNYGKQLAEQGRTLASLVGNIDGIDINSDSSVIEGIRRWLQGEHFAFKKGGLVNYTGPAWVDGTKTAPEAFLSASDTRAIGNAAKILSDLQIIKDYDTLGQVINNTVGDTSIEINLNIENLSSDIDIDNMISRVKDEIVSVANPIGINTILRQT